MSIHPALSQLALTMCPGIDSTDNLTSFDQHEQDLNKQGMFQTFQAWALRNYGDSGKTKTVTKRKYERIIKILKGEEQSTAENSKFRFWVKAKGFRIGCEAGLTDRKDGDHLFVPTRVPSDCGPVDSEKGLKKVAIVEDFFDIIYNVHVEMDGRAGKHAGQKRTYRAIAETYAFLPREAVTRFLMSCSDCQKRMHLTTEILNNNNSKCLTTTPEDRPEIDFGLPITQTYLNHMRKASLHEKECLKEDDSVSSEDSEMSGDRSVSPPSGQDKLLINGQKTGTDESIRSPVNMATSAKCARLDEEVTLEKPSMPTVGDHSEPASVSLVKEESSIERLPSDRSERKRRASDELSLDSSTKASDSGNLDDLQTGKDEDDDDDNDDEDKVLPGQNIDPERLKSFNMFVRLFVDENLDRMVPISKQPKDKIQAILEACDRQFPEFHERSRKRIRTYLKSCRRMRRSKESNGWEPLRPTPPHLTSAAAEGILAQACENESSNAKRMRMGLDPLPASVMQGRGNTSSSTSGQTASAPQPVPPASTTPTQPVVQERPPPPQVPVPPPQPTIPKAHTPTQPTAVERSVAPSDFLRHTPAFRPPHDFHPPFFANGNGMFRPGFPTGYQPPAHHHPQILQHQSLQHTQVQNGPTDLSLKKQNAKSQLSPSEVVTIKQLIAGYRESAAFLYRSADELEQLLLQQN